MAAPYHLLVVDSAFQSDGEQLKKIQKFVDDEELPVVQSGIFLAGAPLVENARPLVDNIGGVVSAQKIQSRLLALRVARHPQGNKAQRTARKPESDSARRNPSQAISPARPPQWPE